MTPPLRAALFDLDGTLLDTAPDMALALEQLCGEEQRITPAFQAIRAQVSHGSSGVLKLAFPDVDAATFERLRARFLNIYRQCLATHTCLFPGFDATLSALERAGIPWGVVTNKPGWLTDPILESVGLQRRAGCVLSGDSLPERKPHPRPLLVAAALLAVPAAECLYFGDAQRDIMAANAAGMVALGARFGYHGPDDDPDSWQARAWLNGPMELLPWVGLAS